MSVNALSALLVSPSEAPIDEFAACRAQAGSIDEELNALNGTIFSAFDRRAQEVLGLSSIAACLRAAGVSVRMVDCRVQRLGVIATVHIIEQHQPVWLGLGVSSALQKDAAVSIVRMLRKRGFANHISFGGLFASASFRELLEGFPEIDSVVLGEGEISSLKVVRALENGGDWRSIDGMAFCSGGVVSVNPRSSHTDFESLPFPARDTVELAAQHESGLPIATLYASRRCLIGCESCAVSGQRSRSWSAPKMVEELSRLKSRFNLTHFQYLDEDFLGDESISSGRIQQFAETLIGSGLNVEFAIHTTAGSVRRSEVAWLKRAGLGRLSLKLESGSAQALKRRNTPITLESIRMAIEVCRDVGVEIDPWMLLIDVRSTTEELRESLDFISQQGLHECRQPGYLLNRLEFFPVTDITTALKYASYDEWVADQGGFTDPRISVIWRRLRQAAVRLHEQYEGRLPVLAARVWLRVRANRSDLASRRILHRLQQSRGHAGKLFLLLLTTSVDVLERSRSTGAAFDSEVESALRNAARDFDVHWLQMPFETLEGHYRYQH